MWRFFIHAFIVFKVMIFHKDTNYFPNILSTSHLTVYFYFKDNFNDS